MSAPVRSAEVVEAAPAVRFARTRAVLAGLVVVGILVSLFVNCARTLTNTDTYFHLRFGQEFLDGWSLRHPGSVSTFATRDWVPTQWLSEIVMARTEDWFGLAGVAWLSGFLEIALFLTLYVVCRDRAEPLVAAAVTATALFAMQNGLSMRPQVDQLPAGRGGRRCLAAHPARRTRPLVAGPAGLGVGDAARDVAGRPRDRRRRGGRPGSRPPAPPGAAVGRPRCPSPRRSPPPSHPSDPSCTPPSPRSGRARSTSPSGGRRTGRAGSSAPWRSCSCSPSSRSGDVGTTLDRDRARRAGGGVRGLLRADRPGRGRDGRAAPRRRRSRTSWGGVRRGRPARAARGGGRCARSRSSCWP